MWADQLIEEMAITTREVQFVEIRFFEVDARGLPDEDALVMEKEVGVENSTGRLSFL